MTAEKFVKSHMPKAKVERQTTNSGNVYYLIRDGRASMWFAEGDTKMLAWQNAKKRIEEAQKINSNRPFPKNPKDATDK